MVSNLFTISVWFSINEQQYSSIKYDTNTYHSNINFIILATEMQRENSHKVW